MTDGRPSARDLLAEGSLAGEVVEQIANPHGGGVRSREAGAKPSSDDPSQLGLHMVHMAVTDLEAAEAGDPPAPVATWATVEEVTLELQHERDGEA